MATKYADILKKATDLLTKSYKFDHKVELKTKTASGVGFKASGKLGAKGVSAELEGNYKKDTLSIDKVRTGTDGNIELEMTLSDVGTDGLNATFKAAEGTAAAGSEKGVFGVDYTNADLGRVRASVDVINSCKLNVDALFTYEGFLFGGEAKFNPNLSFKSEDKKEGDKKDTGFKVDDYNVALGYTGADFDLGVRSENKFDKVNAGYYQVVSDRATVAGTFDYTRGSGAWNFGFGGSCNVTSDSTFQGAVRSNNTVSFAYIQKFNDKVTVTSAAELNVKEPGSDKHKFGLKLAVSA
mmetsp:Transcript_70954/g.125457  ORF Transcript_70954/g.125457 Transcript_70954/m.125457 type:complete len:296 (-) Transcript_70954:232-1119(-)|eukprot:CAMPEP_0197643858 /NCGR_PEP_ID=MMETSP1338-20131121/17026_1 /TAXON_ID=43686 ORGANISM="Pelagodinium beii, Strain RCC1491" /NCGR_SAMPLE_ID=MMETSP1338 /ASSEMBLY_ACC=CAM_ASM_000754 /LENGTH=295 /DNA_ID=CAMNT_0043217157 /DNA_START=131 /DNA_END=1018 /DNA_ORIENTATION=+